MHHVSELVAIGKACVLADTQNAEFAQTNTKFMEIRANLIHSLSLLMEHDNPTIIFSMDGLSLRLHTDIIYVYLSLYEYFDGIGAMLRQCTDQMRMRQIDNIAGISAELKLVYPVLMWTLYIMVLVLEKDWDSLNTVYGNPIPVASRPSQIAAFSQDLFFYCKAVQTLGEGMLYRYHPGYKFSADRSFSANRKSLFENTIKHLNRAGLSPDTRQARNYFSIHAMLGLAEVSWMVNMGSMDLIKQSQKMCRDALKKTDQVPVLKPM